MMTEDNSAHSSSTSHENRFGDPTILPSSSGTSKPMETWSVFGDDECGEPMVAQHLVLDFTPNEDDTDLVQEKICSFWKFINNNPEIQNLKVKPDSCKLYGDWSSTSTPPQKDVKPQPKGKAADITKTACSMLDIAAKEDQIKSAFKTRLHHTVCSMGSYKEEESSQQKKNAHHRRQTKPIKPLPVKKPSSSTAKQLCTELEQWDDKHPKSMAPPGRSPALQHCTIQRQVFKSQERTTV